MAMFALVIVRGQNEKEKFGGKENFVEQCFSLILFYQHPF